jgi:serine protease Do
MKQPTLHRFTTYILVVNLIGFLFLSAGCDLKNENRTKVIGFPQSFAELAEEVRPAVVNISTTSTVRVPGNPFRHFFGPHESDPFGGFFGKFFGDVPDRELKQQSLGSGFIINKDGFIITNNHVVEGAEEIKVKMSDGREFTAKVVGRDPKTDLALIKISSPFKSLPTLPLGDSDSIRVGDWVIAVGNPFGLEHTVTQGIISASGRVIGSGPYDNFLQTDAPINPGNSGGPLVNLEGEVIGINSSIIAGGQGIGFAIPSNTAKSIVAQLKDKGKVIRGWIGVSIQTVTPEIARALGIKEPEGALVGDVVPDGPADKGGIKRGDVIVSFNGKPVKRANDLPMIVADTPVGKTVDVNVIRDKKEMTVKITVKEMPAGKLTSGMVAPQQALGLTVDDITPKWQRAFHLQDKTGVVVIDIIPGSPADDAGIRPGDIIKEIDRKPVRNAGDYAKMIGQIEKDRPVLLLVKRGAQTFYITIGISQ